MSNNQVIPEAAVEAEAKRMSASDGDIVDWSRYVDDARASLECKSRRARRMDVRGGYCGDTTMEATCLSPLAFGECAQHGRRHSLPAPPIPASKKLDGRSVAARAKRTAT